MVCPPVRRDNSSWIIDRAGGRIMLYLTCIISSVDIARYGVSCA